MHISITGDLGSGKSTIAKSLCKALGYKFLSTGSIQRALAQQQGMNTLEFNKYTDHHLHIDDYIDQHLKDINVHPAPHVLDSRLAWFFVPSSFKVYLMTFEEVAAQRIMQDKSRVSEPDAASVKQKIADTKERRQIENHRFEKNYGAKFDIFKNFDLVIDTSLADVAHVTNLILTCYHVWQQKKNYRPVWFSALRIYPLKDLNIRQTNLANTAAPAPSSSLDTNQRQVEIIKAGEDFFLYRGYSQWIMAIQQKLPFIPVKIINSAKFRTRKISHKANELKLKVWEENLGFSYYHYPGTV